MVTDFCFSEDIDTFKYTGFSFRLGFVPVCFYNKRKWEKCFKYKEFLFFLKCSFENQRAYNDSPH